MLKTRLSLEELEREIPRKWTNPNSNTFLSFIYERLYNHRTLEKTVECELFLALWESLGLVVPVETLLKKGWKENADEVMLRTAMCRLRDLVVGTPYEGRIFSKTMSYSFDPLGKNRGYYAYRPHFLPSIIAKVAPGIVYKVLMQLVFGQGFLSNDDFYSYMYFKNPKETPKQKQLDHRRQTIITRSRDCLELCEQTLDTKVGKILYMLKNGRKGYGFIPSEEFTQQPIESQYSHLVVSAPSLSDAALSHQP